MGKAKEETKIEFICGLKTKMRSSLKKRKNLSGDYQNSKSSKSN